MARRFGSLGVATGLLFGVLAWLDSGMPLAGVMTCAITGVFCGIWMQRRMRRHWPGAKDLDCADRVDAVFDSRGNGVVSGIYLVLLLIELLWWPKRRQQILANTGRAAELAGQMQT